MNSRIIGIILLMVFQSIRAEAIIKLPVIFQDNMVLQRDKVVTIWGFGDAREKVSVHFAGQVYRSVTGKDGRWSILLPSQPAGGPYNLVVTGKSNLMELKNILFGDVWICGGQSNMQFSIDQIGYKPTDTLSVKNSNLRIFTVPIELDYVPRADLAGGEWKEVSAENIRNFSATGYFFGKFLYDSLQVPIGLISDNLGATSVETWMSGEALSKFPQFKNYYNEYLTPNKSFKEVTTAFEKIKPAWERDHYLKGKGIDQKWYLPETDTSDWKTMEIPAWWEDKGLAGFDGAVWFRKTFDLPANYQGTSFPIALNQVDDYDIVWVNGTKVGEGFGNQNWRHYSVPAAILKSTGNTIVVRVFDAGGKGGMYSHAIWGNPVLLGNWKYKTDVAIDAVNFPKPHVVNVSAFTTPATLYNGVIAPITSLAIKGFIWYQGESNVSRAEEYRALFPAFINDWRTQFRQGDLPFLFVQLANYMQEASIPGESEWAELREAQSEALKLPRTGMAVTIDIGEVNDIHPKNKMDVGKRLGLAALKVAYGWQDIHTGPAYESMDIVGDTVVMHFSKEGGNLVSSNKYGYVNGFAMAGPDNKFHWAKAFIQNNSVILTCKEVPDPKSVRYAWSDNPGVTNLYNHAGLPVAPFRTDNLPLETSGKLFSENPWEQ